MRGLVLFTLLALVLGAPAVARGSSVEISVQGRDEFETYVALFANPGERNDVTIVFSRGAYEITDRVGIQVPAEAAPECVAVDSDTARCSAPSTDPGPLVHLKNGNDRLRFSGRPPGSTVYDGPGNDLVRGSSGDDLFLSDDDDPELRGRGRDVFLGGRGDDVLFAGPGPDRMAGGRGTDTVSYLVRERAVRVDLDGRADDGSRGERDRVGRDIEDILGGDANDRLVGNGRRNYIDGFGGRDRLVGRGGRDRLENGERVLARDGRKDRIDCALSDARSLVIADRFDVVRNGCARVRRG